jgi:hypothetical protein
MYRQSGAGKGPETKLQADIAHLSLDELPVDRGYINSPIGDSIVKDRGQVVCRPWVPHNDKLFTKRDVAIECLPCLGKPVSSTSQARGGLPDG